jgi:hypothetical protein
MEPEGSSPYSQQPATYPYPEPHRSSLCRPPPPSSLSKVHFNIILSLKHRLGTEPLERKRPADHAAWVLSRETVHTHEQSECSLYSYLVVGAMGMSVAIRQHCWSGPLTSVAAVAVTA